MSLVTAIPPTVRHSLRTWLIVLAGAVALRSGVLAVRWEALRADPDAYRSLALAVLDHGVFGSVEPARLGEATTVRPTAYRPPLYPLVLAAVGAGNRVAPWAVALLHLALGVGTVAAVAVLGRQWNLGAARWVAAALVACDPILLQQSTVVMTETLATALAGAALMLLPAAEFAGIRAGGATDPRSLATPATHSRCRAGAAGIVLGLAVLCRPTFLPWIAVGGLLFLGGVRRERSGREAMAVLLLSVAVVLAPWAVRNWRAFGRPIVTTTHGGYTLLLGNNDAFYDFLRRRDWGDTWDSWTLDKQYAAIRAQFAADEAAADRWASHQAGAAMRRDPAACVRACLFRSGALWGLVPHQVDHPESVATRCLRYAVGAWYALVFGLALGGAWSLGRQLGRFPWLWGVLLLLTFTAVHTLYWSNLRMRAPLMPIVCLAAAQGWCMWRRRWTRRRKTGPTDRGETGLCGCGPAARHR